MRSSAIDAAAWPASKLLEALRALANISEQSNQVAPPQQDTSSWMERQAAQFGYEVQPLESTLADLESDLRDASPALLRMPGGAYLAVRHSGRRSLRVITPDLSLRRLPLSSVCAAIREPATRARRAEIERALGPHTPETVDLLIREQLADVRFDQCWILQGSPGAPPLDWLRQTQAISNAAKLLTAHTVQYLLWLASWVILGSLSFSGHLDRGWTVAWALVLMTLVPFRLATTWLQGALAIGVGGLLKRRLLAGALRLQPEEIRHQGIGSFLGQVFEAEAVETLALSGGIAGLLALIEIAISAFVLGRLALLLALWTAITALLAWKFFNRYRLWTGARLEMTQDVIEGMVGYRTRLAQEPRENWHEEEDRALAAYLDRSRSTDHIANWLRAAVPRGWLLVALACLAPSIAVGDTAPSHIAIALGGILLAFTGFKRLTAAFADIVGAIVPWRRIGPLFHAAARTELFGQPSAARTTGDSAEKVLEADRLTFRYRSAGPAALQSCSLTIRRGERILLEGSSGGGKTTFASLLSGIREPESGLLLMKGVDRNTLGDQRWRRHIASAPQFHENHIITETLGFNLLMGRGWPPTQKDLLEADAVCRELGLGDLLERMPSGLMQMVGEGGWQLSHGERSRIYIARALLQNAELVILDESFAALDPESLQTALECTLNRAETLLVIAHP